MVILVVGTASCLGGELAPRAHRLYIKRTQMVEQWNDPCTIIHNRHVCVFGSFIILPWLTIGRAKSERRLVQVAPTKVGNARKFQRTKLCCPSGLKKCRIPRPKSNKLRSKMVRFSAAMTRMKARVLAAFLVEAGNGRAGKFHGVFFWIAQDKSPQGSQAPLSHMGLFPRHRVDVDPDTSDEWWTWKRATG